MSDKELIKQEIERRIDLYSIAEKDDSTFARMGELSSLIDFIDSLPEESGCEVNFTTKNEDLEKEIENYINDSLAIKFPTTDKEQIKADIRYIARHFAEWQKQIDDKHIGDLQWEAYLKGEQDTKQQMMKDAVDGEYWDGSIYLDNRPTEYKDSDKVKIIIVKEEQQ